MVTIPVGNVKQTLQDFTTFKKGVMYGPASMVLAGSFIDFFRRSGSAQPLKRNTPYPMFVGLGLFETNETISYLQGDGFISTGRTMLCIDLAPLRDGVHHVALNPDAEAVGLDPECFADLHVAATLDLFKDRVLVTLQASATATLECDRTLALFEHSIRGTYRILFVPPTFARCEDQEDGYEEVQVLQPSARVIDLSDAVRDTVLLAVPARKVAPGAEDLEIPTVFGAPAASEEAPIDPRWEALRSLRPGPGTGG